MASSTHLAERERGGEREAVSRMARAVHLAVGVLEPQEDLTLALTLTLTLTHLAVGVLEPQEDWR